MQSVGSCRHQKEMKSKLDPNWKTILVLIAIPIFRYNNITPFDHNRVRLQTPINGSDYINASHITGKNSELVSVRESRYKDMSQKLSSQHKTHSPQTNLDSARFSNINFIASQGPLPNTCVHHLQMIFEQEIDLVIMLTKCEESEKGTDIKISNFFILLHIFFFGF